MNERRLPMACLAEWCCLASITIPLPAQLPFHNYMDVPYSGSFPLPIRNLIAFILPKAANQSGEVAHEFYGYVGLAMILGTLLTLVYRKGDRLSTTWKVMLLTSILLALGINLGLFKVVLFIVPGYLSFRVPARWLFFAHLSLVVLGGMGLNWMLARENAEN